MLLTDSNTKILQNPRIRCTDSQKATMKIGERIPIATGSYGGVGVGTSGVGSALGGLGAVNTQFQYIDVGVNIEMTPTVHYDHDVTLKMKIEVSSENGTSTISGVTEPIIAQKTSEAGDPPARGRGQRAQRHPEQDGHRGLERHSRTQRDSRPQIPVRFQGSSITDDEIVFLLIPHMVRSQDLDPGESAHGRHRRRGAEHRSAPRFGAGVDSARRLLRSSPTGCAGPAGNSLPDRHGTRPRAPRRPARQRWPRWRDSANSSGDRCAPHHRPSPMLRRRRSRGSALPSRLRLSRLRSDRPSRSPSALKAEWISPPCPCRSPTIRPSSR